MRAVDAQPVGQRLFAEGGGDKGLLTVDVIYLVPRLVGSLGVKRLVARLFQHADRQAHALPLRLAAV